MSKIYEKKDNGNIKVYQVGLSPNLDFSLVLIYEMFDKGHSMIGQYLFYQKKQLTFNVTHSQYVFKVFEGFANKYLSKNYEDELFSVREQRVDNHDIISLKCEFLEENEYLNHIVVSSILNMWKRVMHTNLYNFLVYHNDPVLASQKKRIFFEIKEGYDSTLHHDPGFYAFNETIHVSYTEKYTVIDFLDDYTTPEKSNNYF